jgi:hypothetical protein
METKQERKNNIKMHRREFLVDCEDGRRMKLLQECEKKESYISVAVFRFLFDFSADVRL